MVYQIASRQRYTKFLVAFHPSLSLPPDASVAPPASRYSPLGRSSRGCNRGDPTNRGSSLASQGAHWGWGFYASGSIFSWDAHREIKGIFSRDSNKGKRLPFDPESQNLLGKPPTLTRSHK